MAFYTTSNQENLDLIGFTLNIEEKTCLNNSMIIKKHEEKFDNIHLWGKLLGIEQDYFIAQAFHDDFFKRKQDLTTWFELPVPTEQELNLIDSIQGRLMGDPGAFHDIPKSLNSDDEQPKIKEDVRIAGIVNLINMDCEIVPRKAYYRDASMRIRQNPSFKGLEPFEIGKSSSYLYFRDNFQLNSRSISERMNTFDQSIDIFGSIEKDEPLGIWSLQTENNDSVAIVRSLLWPGYSMTHTTLPLRTVSFYYGNGMKNHNLGFMI